jgi:hypothetical protein
MDGSAGGTVVKLVSPLATSAVGLPYLVGLLTHDITYSLDANAVR